jgi:aminomethyltransferase
MGEITIEGPGALAAVQQLVTNDCAKLADGQVLYTVACREDGGVLDDLLVYRRGPERFLLVVNAANSDKLAAWVTAQVPRGLARDASPDFAQIALQGPASRDILAGCPLLAAARPALAGLAFYHFVEFNLQGAPVILSRTGYTGELGYELYLPPTLAPLVAEALMTAGRPLGLKPAGLGARDTLRFEASYCLYGHELNEATDPFEAGLFWLVKLDKGDFIGRDALRARKDDPQARRLVGLALPGRKIGRQGFAVFAGDEAVGAVTSGSFAPTLERSVAMASVARGAATASLAVEVRGERLAAERVKLPFYLQPALRA